MRVLPPIGSRRTASIILLNVALNTVVGFFIFASVFNDKNFGLASIAGNLLFTGIVFGISSGAALKTFNIGEIVASVSPLLFFFLLFIGGSIEKGGSIVEALIIFAMPLIFQGGSWWVGSFVSKHHLK